MCMILGTAGLGCYDLVHFGTTHEMIWGCGILMLARSRHAAGKVLELTYAYISKVPYTPVRAG